LIDTIGIEVVAGLELIDLDTHHYHFHLRYTAGGQRGCGGLDRPRQRYHRVCINPGRQWRSKIVYGDERVPVRASHRHWTTATRRNHVPSAEELDRMFYDISRGNRSDAEIHRLLCGSKKEKVRC
jgi:hypothetical protein